MKNSPIRSAALHSLTENNRTNFERIDMIWAYHRGAEEVIDRVERFLNSSEDKGELGDTLRENLRKELIRIVTVPS